MATSHSIKLFKQFGDTDYLYAATTNGPVCSGAHLVGEQGHGAHSGWLTRGVSPQSRKRITELFGQINTLVGAENCWLQN